MYTKQTDEILSAMSFLYQQIEEIEKYPDKSLFFQDPRVIEGWLVLVRAIKQIEKWSTSEDEMPWEQRSETYVVPLLARRELFLKFKDLYRTYYDLLKQLWDGYSGWIDDGCISAEGIETLITDKYDQVLDIEDFGLHLERVNTRSIDARYSVFKTLSDIFDLLQAVMNRGGQVVIDMNPSDEDIAKAIDNDLREWTLSFGKSLFKDMKEDLNRHFKKHPTDHNTPELWGEMLRADEDALKMAMRKQLTSCEDVKQEHWGEDIKKQMDENDELMRLIYSSCYTEELFDLSKDKSTQQFIALLTPGNLDMFYEIIVRRSLIQCEMFPPLKKQHDAWLNYTEEQPEEIDEEQEVICGEYEVPTELKTEEAEELWKQLRDAGFIIADGYDLAEGISNNQAAYIADSMSGKLKIKNKWKEFEFWGIPNMAQLAGTWKETGKLPPRANEIDEIME